MNRKFLINIIFLIILNLLIKPFWFLGIEVSVQNRVNNTQYGLYFSLLSFTIIFNFLLDLGITNFNNREIARHNHLVSKYFSNIIGVKITLGLIYFLFCLSAGIVFGYSWPKLSLLMLLMLNQFLASFVLYVRSNINGLLMFITDSILSVLDKTLMILILSTLLWSGLFGGRFEIQWFIYAQSASYIMTAIIASGILLKKCDYFIPKIDLRYFIIILRKSLPFSILVLLMALYNRFEPILLERLLIDGKTQAGIYAQGFRILEVLQNFSYLFPVLLYPIFSKMLKQKENINHIISLASSLLVIPSIIIAITCSLYGSEIMNMLYRQPSNGNVFGLLILGFTGISVTFLYGTLLTANGNLRQLNIMASLAVIMNISLNLLLIPVYKAHGAAWSSFTTQTLTALVQLIMAYKILGLKINKPRILRFLFWAILFAAAIIFFKYYFINWKSGFIIIIIFGFLLAIILKLLNLKEIFITLFAGKDSNPVVVE